MYLKRRCTTTFFSLKTNSHIVGIDLMAAIKIEKSDHKEQLAYVLSSNHIGFLLYIIADIGVGFRVISCL